MEKNEIREKAEQRLESFGYAVQQFEPEVTFGVNSEFLDTLQQQIGRPELIRQMKAGGIKNTSPFYWQVTFSPTIDRQEASGSGMSEGEEQPGSDDEEIEMRLDMQGRFMEMLNPRSIVPLQVVNRPALASIFDTGEGTAEKRLSTLTDSLLTQQVIIDVHRSSRRMQSREGTALSRLENSLKQKRPFRLLEKDIFKMASYYLSQTGWETSLLRSDTIRTGRLGNSNISTATVRYEWTNPVFGKQQKIDVRLMATGGLIDVSSAYSLGSREGTSYRQIWPVLRNALIFLFCLAGIIIFFFRIRARAIDTKPALIVAILGGSAAAVAMLLSILPQVNLITDPDGWTTSIMILIGVGISGAAASLAFFVFSAIGDSITRQHWPEKLNLYDYLRQGMIFNKPIGYMMIRSIILAFILAGVLSFMLWLIPHLYIDISQVFLHEQALWPPFYLMLYNGWAALSIVLGIFLVLGGQAYAQTKNKVISSAIMVFACTIIAPIVGSYGPVAQEVLIAVVIGMTLVFIYLRWDAVTLLVSYFLFLGLIRTSTGWIVEGTMDGYIFAFFMVVMGLLFLFGIWASQRGKEAQALSGFIPDYVEELAQEERIRQELQIAREVQESFLPVKTPEFEHLELAALCKPAYETGGDYYDVIRLDDNRIAVTIGDVSGKGIQAAFYMTFVKGILHSLCREIESPAELLKKTNRIFCENANRGVFISLVYGIIDLDKQEFYFARAGHNPILHVDTRTGKVNELRPSGLGIGLATGSPFDDSIEEITLKLSSDDLLILYTDGIVEALNENHTFYGSHRFNNLLARQENVSAADILDTVAKDVNSYIGHAKQHDDMTMVVMKMKK
ncbi:PP2C family protein-serine/threonine phosphatase [Fodinibius roseus]|nr:SpoIIE family protein phosphatase [Fodinibius roseus]